MDVLFDDCLIHIFKLLDLRSRLVADKMCKRWRRLVGDTLALLDDVSQVYLNKWKPDHENSEVPSVLAVFFHLKNCRQLMLGPGVGHGFLSEERLTDEMNRFEKVSLIPKYPDRENSIGRFLPLLTSSVKRLQVVGCLSHRFALNLSNSVQLEDLDMTVDSVGYQDKPFVLPSTLTHFGYAYWCTKICNYEIGVFPLPSAEATVYFLQNLRVSPLLSELYLHGMAFSNESFASLLSIIRKGSPNLDRISFQEVNFDFHDTDALIKQFSTNDGRLFPFKWIKIGRCVGFWSNAARLLLSISNAETLVIHFRIRCSYLRLSNVYELAPLMKQKGTKLELAINLVDRPWDLEDILVPSELCGVLSKIELINAHYTQLLQTMLNVDSFNLLTEIRLESCIGLGDATLEVVAEWCENLKKLKFKPHHGLDPHVVTDQCLVPFLSYWDDRNSTQLTIECLEPAHPFGGFNLPINQERGIFQDGKKWMLFRKACLLAGCDHMGTRLAIWDRFQKSMVITDYKRNFDRHVKISVEEGKCTVKEKRDTEFVVKRSR